MPTNHAPFIFGSILALAAAPLLHAQAATPAKPAESAEEVVELSPFEVVADTKGYFAANTMSGTRLNARLEDLGASISVVTKQQMEDLGLLDVNDIFSYESNTEGTANFTDFSFNSAGMPMDNVQTNPVGANRVRGIGPANTTFGNFETSGRTPIDPTNVDGVEISRGPNSSIFGVGSPAGTVNSVPASANLRKNATTIVARVDNRDGWRTSFDVNRVLKPNVLAARVSGVKQLDGFALKPSGVATERLNGMLKFHPFRKTTLTASYSYYRAHGNRPNALAPRDGISGWLGLGAPTWDPITSTAKIDGRVVGSSLSPYFSGAVGTIIGYIDQNGLGYLGQARGSPGTTPLTQNQNVRLVVPVVDPSGYLATQPLFQKYPVLANKAIYDWSRFNLAAMNRFEDKNQTSSVVLEQSLLQTRRQMLDLQLGLFRENTDRFMRNFLGALSPASNFASTVTLDVNERLLDGAVNPYFLRPFIQLDRPNTYKQPVDRDTYRAQLAYRLDLRHETGWRQWLGLHQVSGYAEYKNIESRQYMLRDALVSNHAWTDSTTNRGDSSTYDLYPRFYLGDNKGYNVDYGSTAYNPGTYMFRWGNAVTQQFVNEAVQIGTAVASGSGNGTGGLNNNRTILKSQGAVVQSFFLKDRLVTTLGLREDKNYSRLGATPRFLDPITLEEASFNAWAPGNWIFGSGKTTTAGVVAKPLRWLGLTGNKSASFQPSAVGVDLYKHILPDPSGAGHDFGFYASLLDNRLVVRFNRYKTTQINSRNGDSSNIAQRVRRLDYAGATGAAYNLQRQATLWLTEAAAAKGQTLTADQLLDQLSTTMGLPKDLLASPPDRPYALDDVTARGTEIEVNYNPTNFWTLKANVTQQESINAGLSAGVTQWITDRLAVWETIIDPRNNQKWYTQDYGGGSAQAYFTSNVLNPLQIAQAFQGKSKPQIRQYRVNAMSSYRLAGITENRLLKRFTVGGAVRWEDRGAIGFRGTQDPPAIITTLDPSRPIWDKAHTYFDAFVTYRTRVYSEKVGLTLQLNVRNLTEGGRLQPVAAEADGRISAFRIIDPRLFIFTATFNL
jgi:outer membrane receptor protein involved in Fe transport